MYRVELSKCALRDRHQAADRPRAVAPPRRGEYRVLWKSVHQAYSMVRVAAFYQGVGQARIRPNARASCRSDLSQKRSAASRYDRMSAEVASVVRSPWVMLFRLRTSSSIFALRSHLEIMPRISSEILFPTPCGCYMRRSTWSSHWHAVRAAAQMPGLEFYELRHRAIQWMIDPPHDGGLGLDIQSAAHIAGHHDGGYLVRSTYSKLAEHRALARTRRAVDAYQQRAGNPHSSSRGRPAWHYRSAARSLPAWERLALSR